MNSATLVRFTDQSTTASQEARDPVERPERDQNKVLLQHFNSGYRKEWGDVYEKRGFFARFQALILRLMPKIGSFSAGAFRQRRLRGLDSDQLSQQCVPSQIALQVPQARRSPPTSARRSYSSLTAPPRQTTPLAASRQESKRLRKLLWTRCSVSMAAGQQKEINLQFQQLASVLQAITVVALSTSLLTPDPAQTVLIHDQVLDANPGRPLPKTVDHANLRHIWGCRLGFPTLCNF